MALGPLEKRHHMQFRYKGGKKEEGEGEKGLGEWRQGKEWNLGINHEAFAKSVINNMVHKEVIKFMISNLKL